MNAAMYLIVGIGLVASIVLLVLALRAGREEPVHRIAWIVGLVALCLGAAFHLLVSYGALSAGGPDMTWVLVGTLALLVTVGVAVLRPRWAGLGLIITGAWFPALLWLAELIVSSGVEETVPVPVMLGFYSVPAAIVGTVLLLSTVTRRREVIRASEVAATESSDAGQTV